MTSRLTSRLPRVAFEYGQTWCAAAISFSASSSASPPTVASRLATSPKPPPSRGPMPTLALISSDVGRSFIWRATNSAALQKQAA